MVLLLLIYCLIHFPLFVGVLCLSLFSLFLIYVISFIVLGMSCYCKCPATLPLSGVGWSAVCECGVFGPYSITSFFMITMCWH